MNRFPHVATYETPGVVTGQDRYGNPITGKDAGSTEGMLQPRSGREDTTGGDFQTGNASFYYPLGVNITGSSTLTVLGLEYEVIGPPEVWQIGSPLDHCRAVLRRVTG